MQSIRKCLQYSTRRSPSLRYFGENVTSAANTNSNPPIENLTVPPPSSMEKPASDKIEKLFTDISRLNLIEVSELSDLLKKRLNLSDISAVPMVAAASPAEEEDVAPVKVKSSFTVKLMKFDDKQKVALIKEMKTLMEGMNLVQAKKFVESAPAVVRTDISKEDAEKLKETIEKAGGVVEIV
ncbi:hypothetical protein WA026_001252 [Henosepilachna vigintioctopunctata]|uniref:Mitochondrial ribosomal protein L12 n=1 Tax=Henosepilachna vigintioctopunctata TaxID=420089 RepID=A0AAW1UQE4_9CUCU